MCKHLEHDARNRTEALYRYECSPSYVDLSWYKWTTRWETVSAQYRQWGCIAGSVFITNNPDTPGTIATIPTHRGSRGTMPDLWPYTFYISKPGTKRIHKQFPAMSGHASISRFYVVTGLAFLPQNDSIQKAALPSSASLPPSCMTWRDALLPPCSVFREQKISSH